MFRRRRGRRRGGARSGLTAIAVGAVAGLAASVVVVGALNKNHEQPLRSDDAGTPAANQDCTLTVPANPLTARGLATPYQLTATNPADGPCDEANVDQTAFVQGAVLNPRTGQVSVYNPVVVDQGARPAAAPVVPTLPAGAVVALWFGFNGDDLSLKGAAGDCVAGQSVDGHFSSFIQVAACNAQPFFRAATTAIRAGKLRVPSPGTARDGLPCLTTRSFALIDQDQSDNVTTQYLTTASGQIAQDTAAGRKALPGASTLFNGSDNGLLDQFVDPALGCAPWEAPDLGDNGAPAPALPLDELQAAAYAGRVGGAGPAALVPLNDPMTVDGKGNFSSAKTDAFRSLVDMPPLPAGQTPKQYCTDMDQVQGTRLQQDVNLLRAAPSPDRAEGDNLFTFMARRMQESFANLKCGSFGLTNDVSTTSDDHGVAVAACFARQVAPVTKGPGNPAAGMRTCPRKRRPLRGSYA